MTKSLTLAAVLLVATPAAVLGIIAFGLICLFAMCQWRWKP